MRKVLFLDVDGVLNHGFPTALRPELIDRYLNWKAKHPEVEVVLASSWRIRDTWKEELRSHSINWDSETEILSQPRGTEIDQWLIKQPLRPGILYAILDDNDDFHYWQRDKHLVRTDETKGLQDHHLRQLDLILKLE